MPYVKQEIDWKCGQSKHLDDRIQVLLRDSSILRKFFEYIQNFREGDCVST
jgi:hypothetical protein